MIQKFETLNKGMKKKNPFCRMSQYTVAICFFNKNCPFKYNATLKDL